MESTSEAVTVRREPGYQLSPDQRPGAVRGNGSLH